MVGEKKTDDTTYNQMFKFPPERKQNNIQDHEIGYVIDTLVEELTGSYYQNLMFLITQTSFAAPMRKKSLSLIHIPIRDVSAEYYSAILAVLEEAYRFIDYGQFLLCSGYNHESLFTEAGDCIRTLQKECNRARQAEFQLEELLEQSETLLISELRGSHGLETLLRYTRRCCILSSYRLEIMERLPRRISRLCRGARNILTRINRLEELVFKIQTQLWDPEWRARHMDQQEVLQPLVDILEWESRQCDGVKYYIGYLYDYTPSKEPPIRPDYRGPWDPNNIIWNHFWWWL
ncbi:uncharacterized protein EV420DRAFT_1481912 [Desarmillaria tabescens]|uniref:Uncharacterized protein n=1 Tax=Armillaria tabescens TaxID=1929756 RepID=A0AA39K1K6_ARMTA|nr:uncharacterized protein EV420DRAFT_1481912 [Desarmillaria tabescens]KAK0452917.1 hypothetical protein EV420DRAFT_1481912 [Desarmillaria tabescens]